jgi:cytochrome c biogenesis protein CcmG/thiol:disulfide interchange protein DsbE
MVSRQPHRPSAHRPLVLLLALCAVLLLGCDEPDDGQIAAREPAADFVMTLLDGGSFRLSDHKGSPVIVNFFASWCIPCKIEAPVLEKAFQDCRDRGVMVVGVAIQDTESKARDFVDELGLTYPTGLDADGKIKESFGVFGIPMTFFVDREGLISYTHVGVVTEGLMRYELDKIL